MAEPLKSHDHSGLALHLRSIHFLLIICSAIVFIFAISANSNNHSKVLLEYRELHKFVHAEEWNSQFTRDLCIQQAKSKSISNNKARIKLISANKLKVWKKIKDQVYIWQLKMTTPLGYYCELKVNSNKEHASLLSINAEVQGRYGYGMQLREKPVAISEFVKMWNEFALGMSIHRFDSIDLKKSLIINANDLGKQYDAGFILARGADAIKSYRGPKVGRIKYKRDFRVYRNLVPKLALEFGTKDLLKPDYFLMSENKFDDDVVLVVPVYTQRLSFSALSAFMQYLNIDQSIIKPGLFAQSFPYLAELISKSSKIKKLEDLELFLRESEFNTGKQVNVFGIKMAALNVLYLGAVIITVLALYFWLIIRALTYKIVDKDLAFSSSWFGLFPDYISFLSTVVSCMLLPLIVAGWQFYNFFEATDIEGKILSVIPALVLFVVSVLSIIVYIRLHRKALELASYAE